MKKKKASRVSLKDIARVAGVSKAAVGFALQNRPGVSAATRARIVRLARKMGYVPDARIASWMGRVSATRTRSPLPIAWLNTNLEENAWHTYKFLIPYLEGARERSDELGFKLEEIWTRQPGLRKHSVSKMLYQRGIEGVIVTYPARSVRLGWDHLAGVALDGGLLVPRLHRVITDRHYNLLLAIKMVQRHGYRRIGISLDDEMDRFASRVLRATANQFNLSIPKERRVPSLFYSKLHSPKWTPIRTRVINWIRTHRPDVIIGHTVEMVKWVEEAGYRVPQEIGVVHLATDDDAGDWAGVASQRRTLGKTAAELVISLMRNRQFGVPPIAMGTAIRGTWQPGRTLLIPKPR